MKTISASYLRTQSVRVLAEVARTREPVVVTKRGRPIAKVVPALSERPGAYGIAKGTVGDFTEDMFSAVEPWEPDAP